MSSFSVKLIQTRPSRYVFEANLWDSRAGGFSARNVEVLLDTGAFNTLIHAGLVKYHGVMLPQTLKTSIGGYSGNANICVLQKLQMGGHVLEKVVALAVPFQGELKDHILLGANVINNWKFTVSRLEHEIHVTEQFSSSALERQYPYRYCYDNTGHIMAFQDFESEETP